MLAVEMLFLKTMYSPEFMAWVGKLSFILLVEMILFFPFCLVALFGIWHSTEQRRLVEEFKRETRS
jgi:hypothetical protein